MKFTLKGKRYIWRPPLWLQMIAVTAGTLALLYGVAFAMVMCSE